MDFQLGEIHCFAEVLGEGPPLLAIHGGFGLDHAYFRPGLDSLAQSHQLILIDLRGHGRSAPLPQEAFRIEAVVEDLEAVRLAMGHDAWSILGHSGGGLIAAAYAAQYPTHLDRLILCCSFPRYPFQAPEWMAAIRAADDQEINRGVEMFLKGLRTDAAYRKAFLRIAPLFFADPAQADITPFEEIIYRVAPYTEATTHYTDVNMGERLRDFSSPVCIIHGARDARAPARLGREWLAYLPDAIYRELPDTGHFPFIEQSKIFCDIVCAFLMRPPTQKP
jgi:proline iminopeptidase